MKILTKILTKLTFGLFLMMMYWKILRKCVFLFHICVCPTYLFLFLFLLFLLLFFFLLLLFPFLGVIENAVFFQFPFPGAIENAVFFQFPFPGVVENAVFFQFLFFSVYEVLCFSSSLSLSQFPFSSLPVPFPVPFADSLCFSKESALQTFFFKKRKHFVFY